jgi:hypothetical protein
MRSKFHSEGSWSILGRKTVSPGFYAAIQAVNLGKSLGWLDMPPHFGWSCR